MRTRVFVDTGPLVALLDRNDRFNVWVKEQLESVDAPLETCEAVLSEASFLLRRIPGGPQALLDLLTKGLVKISFSLQDESRVVQRLLMRYAGVPMSLADACMVRLSETCEESVVLTLDSDFRIYRRNGRSVIPVLLPDR